MFNSFYGGTLSAYQSWASSGFRSPAVPDVAGNQSGVKAEAVGEGVKTMKFTVA